MISYKMAKPAPLDIGKKLREIRSLKKLTLKEVSQKSGVSITQISEVERNLTSPTVPTLIKIAKGLGQDISVFFESNNKKQISIVRKNERNIIIDRVNNVISESLTSGIVNTKLKVVVGPLKHGKEIIRGGFQHEGEELDFVLTGTVLCKIGDESFILEEGDSIHFNAELKHSFISIGDGDAELLAVITPPNY